MAIQRKPPLSFEAVARSLLTATLWTFLAALTAALAVGISVLLSGGIAGLVWVFGRGTDVVSVMTMTAGIGLLVGLLLVAVVAVWVAAYGATPDDSFPRTAVAVPVGIAIAIGLFLLETPLAFTAGLALGWAVAIPGSAGRMAVRAIPILVAGVASIGWVVPGAPWSSLAVAPLLAALVVAAGDAVVGLATKTDV